MDAKDENYHLVHGSCTDKLSSKEFSVGFGVRIIRKGFSLQQNHFIIVIDVGWFHLDQLELKLSRNVFRNWSRIVNIVSYVLFQNESTNSSENLVFDCIHGFGSNVG